MPPVLEVLRIGKAPEMERLLPARGAKSVAEMECLLRLWSTLMVYMDSGDGRAEVEALLLVRSCAV